MAASASDESGDLTHTVARHYNELQEAGKHARKESRIFYLRNFNNWIKSILIGDTIKKIREESSKKELVVMDLCSGKGGDLLKWKKGGITRLVCADIAGTSVEQCENRYKEMVERGRRDRYPQPIYDAEFITADCTKVRLLEQLQDPSMRFDLVSCQFSFHYSFESHTQADMMLRNACERLRPGGYFIGTTPNSYELVRRLQDSDGYSFGNDVYRVTFPEGTKSDFQLFGAKYDFHLEGVVDCPEFLVYFPALEKMAERYGMKLVMLKPFAQYFEAVRGEWDNVKLLNNMQGMEAFPPDEGATLMGEEEEYQHARDFLSKVSQSQTEDDHRRHRNPKIGTLSKAEWEATTIYLAFVFKKLGAPPSASTIQSQMVPTSSTLPRKRKHSEDD